MRLSLPLFGKSLRGICDQDLRNVTWNVDFLQEICGNAENYCKPRKNSYKSRDQIMDCAVGRSGRSVVQDKLKLNCSKPQFCHWKRRRLRIIAYCDQHKNREHTDLSQIDCDVDLLILKSSGKRGWLPPIFSSINSVFNRMITWRCQWVTIIAR